MQDKLAVTMISLPNFQWDALNRASHLALGKAAVVDNLDDLDDGHITVSFAIVGDDLVLEGLVKYRFRMSVQSSFGCYFIIITGDLRDYRRLILDIGFLNDSLKYITSGIISSLSKANLSRTWNGYTVVVKERGLYEIKSR